MTNIGTLPILQPALQCCKDGFNLQVQDYVGATGENPVGNLSTHRVRTVNQLEYFGLECMPWTTVSHGVICDVGNCVCGLSPDHWDGLVGNRLQE